MFFYEHMYFIYAHMHTHISGVFSLLTVSHLARARSSSNLANSRRSWMVMSSFQMSRAARPKNKMAPATDRSTTKISGPLGQSGKGIQSKNQRI